MLLRTTSIKLINSQNRDVKVEAVLAVKGKREWWRGKRRRENNW